MKRLLFVIGLLFTLAACSKTENLQSQKDADVSLIESRASTDNSPSLPDGSMTIYEKMDALMMGLIPNLPVDPLFAGYVYSSGEIYYDLSRPNVISQQITIEKDYFPSRQLRF